mgnify:CR=1 FL=1
MTSLRSTPRAVGEPVVVRMSYAGESSGHPRPSPATSGSRSASAARLAAKIGRTLPVIIDEVGEPDEDGDIGATGRSQADAPEIDGAVYLRQVPDSLRVGDIVPVTVEDADAHDLYGFVAE